MLLLVELLLLLLLLMLLMVVRAVGVWMLVFFGKALGLCVCLGGAVMV